VAGARKGTKPILLVTLKIKKVKKYEKHKT